MPFHHAAPLTPMQQFVAIPSQPERRQLRRRPGSALLALPLVLLAACGGGGGSGGGGDSAAPAPEPPQPHSQDQPSEGQHSQTSIPPAITDSGGIPHGVPAHIKAMRAAIEQGSTLGEGYPTGITISRTQPVTPPAGTGINIQSQDGDARWMNTGESVAVPSWSAYYHGIKLRDYNSKIVSQTINIWTDMADRPPSPSPRSTRWIQTSAKTERTMPCRSMKTAWVS